MVFKTAFSFIAKLFAYKKGSLLLFSALMSSGITFYLGEIMKGTEVRRVVIPIMVQMVGFCFFFLFELIDLFTGLWAAKYLNEKSANPQENYIKSYKLYRTLWKTLGVLLLNTLITFICIFAEIMDADYIYGFILWSLVTVWIMACGFEFHSIGENIEKRTGTKPEIFGFLDGILEIIQKKATSKVGKIFDVLESEPEKSEPKQDATAEPQQDEPINNTENETN